MVEPQNIVVGEISVKEVWERLAASKSSTLIDVRTYAEWSYVGCVDLSDLGKKPILIEWLQFPRQEINAQFVNSLDAELKQLGLGHEADLYFLCRSGVRSLAAAEAMISVGYKRCFNVVNGFEGPPNADQHRGKISGWKAEGLPWKQS